MYGFFVHNVDVIFNIQIDTTKLFNCQKLLYENKCLLMFIWHARISEKNTEKKVKGKLIKLITVLFKFLVGFNLGKMCGGLK